VACFLIERNDNGNHWHWFGHHGMCHGGSFNLSCRLRHLPAPDKPETGIKPSYWGASHCCLAKQTAIRFFWRPSFAGPGPIDGFG
jgi:hypothetical protein